jgi:hypothetical protein
MQSKMTDTARFHIFVSSSLSTVTYPASILIPVPTTTTTHSRTNPLEHQPTLDIAPARKPAIDKIAPPRLPRRNIPALGELLLLDRLHDVRAIQIEDLRLLDLRALRDLWHRARHALSLHVLEQPDEQPHRRVRAERPRRIGVPEDEREILLHISLSPPPRKTSHSPEYPAT